MFFNMHIKCINESKTNILKNKYFFQVCINVSDFLSNYLYMIYADLSYFLKMPV